MDSTHSPKGPTSILDLNDDCLQFVFEYYDLNDLVTVADVCRSFRQNAQACFERTESKKWHRIYLDKGPKLMKASRFLRNFGAFIKKIYLWRENLVHQDETFQEKCEWSLRLVDRYCCPIEMEFGYFIIKDNAESLMRPLLSRLQTLALTCCEMSVDFVNALPESAPGLQELELFSPKVKTGIFVKYPNDHQKFEIIGSLPAFSKLERLILYCSNIINTDIDSSLKANPQLKVIRLILCDNNMGNSDAQQMLKSIGNHVPCVETIAIEMTGPIYQDKFEYFDQLKNLRSLHLGAPSKGSAAWMVGVLRKIAAAEIPLEIFSMNRICLGNESDRFVDEISKLRHLKKLKLTSISGLSAGQLVSICKELNQLSELYSDMTPKNFSAHDLLELVRNVESLEAFDYFSFKRDIVVVEDTVSVFQQISNVVANRRKNRHLRIYFQDYCSWIDNIIPDEFIRANKQFLTFSSCFHEESHQHWHDPKS